MPIPTFTIQQWQPIPAAWNMAQQPTGANKPVVRGETGFTEQNYTPLSAEIRQIVKESGCITLSGAASIGADRSLLGNAAAYRLRNG